MDNKIQESKKEILNYFQAFEKLLKKGNELGIDLNEIESKLSSIIENIQNGKIMVALVGGFSEGKTTLAASWLGRLEDNMKIDPDESSDDIQIYRPEGLEADCEIIDTPGLYGGKSFEDGTKFKDLTLKYVSEAHLILFVLDPVNPIKDSHAETIKWLFRDLNKIDSVIFVLNKMDQVADLTDPEDFKETFDVKKKNIEDALDRMIGLSPEEREALTICAVSANPKGKGLEFWFNRISDYIDRSKIGNLRKLTNGVLSKSKSSLIKNASISGIRDIIIQQKEASLPILNELCLAIESRKDALDALKNDFTFIQKKINDLKAPLKEELITYKNELFNKFNGADQTNIFQYFTEEIGENAINYQSRVLSIVERYVNEINGLSNNLVKSFQSELDFVDNLLEKNNSSLIKMGVNGLKAIPIKQLHSVINSSRHFLNNSLGTAIKFKPWGITKLAKGASGVFAGLVALVEVWETISIYRKNKKLENSKNEIIKMVSKTIDEQLKIINDKEDFIKTFAPNLNDLKSQIDAISAAYNSALENKLAIEEWAKKVEAFSSENIEDIEYQEA